MKKFLIVLLFLAAETSLLWSEGFNLGKFPLGKWLDARWNAVWEFSSDNIRIVDPAGSVYYDFKGKTIENYSVKPSLKGVVLSFYCKETGKKYTFTKPVSNLNLLMNIKTDTGNTYNVELPFQK